MNTFYLIIEDRFGSQEYISESTRFPKTIDEVIEALEGDDTNPIQILEISDDSAPCDVIEDVAIAYAKKLIEQDQYEHDDLVKYHPWLDAYIDAPSHSSSWQEQEAAQYRAAVL